MKINVIEPAKVIISNPKSLHSYFAWPSIARLGDGRLVTSCSGFRIRHICPFGKAVICFSSDEGKSWTKPMPVIDTVLDDRDAGVCTFGKSGLIVTSFNNETAFQRRHAGDDAYSLAYLDKISEEAQNEALGARFAISYDNGTTFEKQGKSPITCPHGPTELKNGKILWVGRRFSKDDSYQGTESFIKAYELSPTTGEMQYLGEIENVYDEHGLREPCEPYAIELPDGRILCLMRTHRYNEHKLFTLSQSISEDGGKTWSTPKKICGEMEGAPAHLMLHSSGALICSYGHREKPYGIRVAFSHDLGETWDFGYQLGEECPTNDLGYPSTVELSDGSLLTVFYSRNSSSVPAEIYQIKWSFNK